jgi:multidrug efflux pump subunit AcrA (membrane-fusion protein)
VARQQAEAQARIDAELAEIRRQAAELQAQRQAEEDRTRQALERQRHEREAAERAANPVPNEPAAEPVRQPVDAEPQLPPPPPPLVEPPATLTIGRINTLLAPVSITSAGLQQMGFSLQSRPVPGVHFLASDWELMKAAIIKHVGSRV